MLNPQTPPTLRVRTALRAGWANDSSYLYALRNRMFEDLHGANLQGENLSWTDFSFADLSDANLRGASLEWALLSNADLSFADIRGASLYGAALDGTNFTGTVCDASTKWFRGQSGATYGLNCG